MFHVHLLGFSYSPKFIVSLGLIYEVHDHTPHPVGLLRMSDRVAKTSTRQLTTLSKDDTDAPDGIRTRNPSKAVDPCFRRRGHRHRRFGWFGKRKYVN
jgi:hypothetical protein